MRRRLSDSFQASADKGNAQAQYQLAQMYAKGWGVPQNYSSALLWDGEIGGGRRSWDGENRMGVRLYDEGYGVQKDAKLVAAYFYRYWRRRRATPTHNSAWKMAC